MSQNINNVLYITLNFTSFLCACAYPSNPLNIKMLGPFLSEISNIKKVVKKARQKNIDVKGFAVLDLNQMTVRVKDFFMLYENIYFGLFCILRK